MHFLRRFEGIWATKRTFGKCFFRCLSSMKRIGLYGAFLGIVVGMIGWQSASAQAEKAAVEGLVLDGATRQPVAGAKVDVYHGAGQVVQSKLTDIDGSFRISLAAKEAYQVIVQAKDYVNSSEQIDFSDPRVVSKTGRTFYLTKVPDPINPSTPSVVSLPPPKRMEPPAPTPPKPEPTPPPVVVKAEVRPVVVTAAPTPVKPEPRPVVLAKAPERKPTVATPPPPIITPPKAPLTVNDRPFEIRPIFFTQGTAEVLPESRESMEMLLRFLSQNPGVTVELTGHTDNQGDFDLNVALSKQRADVVKTFLLTKGIVPRQVRTRGFGGIHPAITNNYEKNRPFNRRVEIRIVKE
jgi:OmpA-OmpF porin, OOP family